MNGEDAPMSKNKIHIVLWYHNNNVRLNGRYHRSPTPSSTRRLSTLLDRIAYLELPFLSCIVYHVYRYQPRRSDVNLEPDQPIR